MIAFERDVENVEDRFAELAQQLRAQQREIEKLKSRSDDDEDDDDEDDEKEQRRCDGLTKGNSCYG